MALLATSCTMRNKPSRLLDKGPEYLRTRTNDQIFAHRRKSAVELLAASRPQYVKSAALLDSAATGLTAGTPDRHFRSICQPRERPPRRSKSEFDVSKLQELLDAEDEADGRCGLSNIGRDKVNDERRPLSAEEKGERDKREGAPRSTPSTAADTTATWRGEAESGEQKINTAPDRQDETRPLLPPRSHGAAASSTLPPPPPSSQPPPPSTPSSVPSADTQSPAPAIYTARPIYINLSRCPSHGAAAASASRSTGNSSTPASAGHHSISVLSVGSHLLTPATAMSEESSDRTPTNPTGGGVITPGQASTPSTTTAATSVFTSQIEVSEEEEKEAGIVASSPPASGPAGVVSPPPVTAASASSSPGPRVSLRGSCELGSVSMSLGHSPVPRSFSDISCHHSRAGSDVSSEASRASRTSRASRASAGANLEKFFNEMGMERDVLDPMFQLQRRFGGGIGGVGGSEQDIYESVSSLESHEARSICSALSRSEKEISDAESFERNQQQTSIVERNARIIKWLCSVKKAKTPATSVQGSAAS